MREHGGLEELRSSNSEELAPRDGTARLGSMDTIGIYICPFHPHRQISFDPELFNLVRYR